MPLCSYASDNLCLDPSTFQALANILSGSTANTVAGALTVSGIDTTTLANPAAVQVISNSIVAALQGSIAKASGAAAPVLSVKITSIKDAVTGHSTSFLRGLQPEANGLRAVLRHAEAFAEVEAKVVGSARVASPSGCAVELDGLVMALLEAAFAVPVHDSEVELRTRHVCGGGAPPPIERLHVVFGCSANSVAAALAECVHRREVAALGGRKELCERAIDQKHVSSLLRSEVAHGAAPGRDERRVRSAQWRIDAEPTQRRRRLGNRPR